MLRESVQQPWAQDPWPLIDSTDTSLLDTTSTFDSSSFLNAEQLFQLQDLFGQDDLDFDRGGDASLLYDEFTFVPEHTNVTDISNLVDTIEPTDLLNQAYVENIMNTLVTEVPVMKRRRSSSCSSSSSLSSYSSSSSSSSEGDEEMEDFSYFSNNRRYSSDSSNESETEVILPFVHRRQMEEDILDKITNRLEAEKLPGILTIISKKHEDEVEEVEIDLSRLDLDQLERILSYVNACLKEKEGGPKVKLSDYIIQPVKPQVEIITNKQPPVSKSKRQRRKNNNTRCKSIVEEGHTVSGTTTQLSSTQGPISMSALTLLEQKTSKRKRTTTPAKKQKKKNKDTSVHMSPTTKLTKDSIASTKPKRKSAIHKRRLLEEMLQPSDDSEEEEETDDNGSGIILYGNERMDLAVTQNETIVHNQATLLQCNTLSPSIQLEADLEEEDGELIDIMM